MTLSGGPANKLGNRYEKWWTVSEIVRMLHGDTESLRIEDPSVDKAEFVVNVGAWRELHQVKRSHPNGKWSLAALRADGLLQAIGEQLAGNSDQFVFASGSDARELAELCNAASGAESTDEFESEFLAAKERREQFERLRNYWNCDVPTAVERLRRIEVRTIGERDLEQKVRWGLRALFVANTGHVLDELLKIVEDSVHRTLTRQDLVKELEQRGYQLRHLRSPEHAGIAVATATDRYLDGARRRLIQQTLVPRTAAQTLLSHMEEKAATDSVLTGRAGSGKTAGVVEVAEGLRARGLPVLAFRLDRYLSVSTTTDLGHSLDLEESPVLVLAAAAEAAGCPGVLIVDQLDAVSTMSGRSSGAFDLVERLLQEARGTRARATIHTIVVCRAFDWMNDSRLRQLISDSHAQVDVTEFAVDEVKTILADAGFDPALFRERQLKLLQLPQNLSLFLESGFDASRAHAFSTATELFERYWAEKRQSVAARVAPSPDQWMEVVQTLCNEMTAGQQLSVAKEKLDNVSTAYLDQVASEGVVTFDGHRYGFGHESFFDYCFARVFFTRSESLVSFLKGSEQHLFRRAQVRQALAYLRDAEFTRYVRELEALVTDDGIRTHIKDLAFALLAEVTDPTEEEWTIWGKWAAPEIEAVKGGTPNPNKLSALAWRRFFGSRSWFKAADQRGMIGGWLASGNDLLADMAMDYMRVHQRHSPDCVAALLEPYADGGGEWPRRLSLFVVWADLHKSRRVFDLLLRLVDNGALDDVRRPTMPLNHTLLADHRPEWVPEFVAHWFRRRVVVIRAADGDLGRGEILGYDGAASEMFAKSAKRAPARFVEHVLPVVLDISESAVNVQDEPPKGDAIWSRYVEKTDFPSGEDACLSGLSEALAALAGKGADLDDVIADLRRRDTHLANHLLLALYRGGGSHYANDVVPLLCDEQWRFECGFSDSPNWCAMELIQAVVPHCTDTNRGRLENVIMRYIHAYERTAAGYKQHGRTRFALLSVIPVELRSRSATIHFDELARKFGQPEDEPHGVTGGWIGSPINETATREMTDEQWLRAIRKYQSEYPTYSKLDDLKGGARELAQALEKRVKEEPDRFARLSLRFPPDANPTYLESTLAALKSAAAATVLKIDVCRKAFADSRKSCGKAIADVIGSIEDRLPDDAVQMLHWLATDHEDPATEAWREAAPGGGSYYGGNIPTHGINTTRGRAALAVRDLILRDVVYIDHFRSTLDRMVRDQSVSVISCVAGTLRAVAYHDLALGLSLFLRMNMSEERLLATRDVCEFIRCNLRDSFFALRPIVERMLRSSEPRVCQAGASLASIANLLRDDAADLVVEALGGNGRQRRGVAQVAAANAGVPEYRACCEATLVTMFDDGDTDVRRKAASCFEHLPDDSLDTYGDLIAAFCDSTAFREQSFPILRVLESSLGRLPGMTCVICEKFLDRFAGEHSNKAADPTGDTYTLSKLIFRTYQQHQNDDWTSRLLDLIDRLCIEGIGGAREQFEQFER